MRAQRFLQIFAQIKALIQACASICANKSENSVGNQARFLYAATRKLIRPGADDILRLPVVRVDVRCRTGPGEPENNILEYM